MPNTGQRDSGHSVSCRNFAAAPTNGSPRMSTPSLTGPIAHFEGLGIERQQAIDDLQASERRLIDALVAGIHSKRPAAEDRP